MYTTLKGPKYLNSNENILVNDDNEDAEQKLFENELRNPMTQSLHENFISNSEEESLLKEIDPIFKRRRYQFDHWDGAIQGYKETEKENWNEENSKILQRLCNFSFSAECPPTKLVHVLDLSKTGFIKPHVDSVKFCGSIISGISLLSASVMRLAMEENKNMYVDVLLRRRSLYIMSGLVRYKFTHEILKDSESFFNGMPIPRDRRISVICRNEPEEKYRTNI
ncbi:alpha-ketoglutarate-dependent dioxygenase alkB homolog 7, mitochondrial [Trichonephila inaurata madagascariensis]|uniref:Alpha-ketoglutarate-dependent dioxygenase alkB homolog 7, mitochondrial n=1 Tax=Trichonephila inaurata madagascariensis TaxID=2747483 RepID=A0A8X6IYI9_9ARAC|nr:alpha-ketoglutarate-dependent dioxygenase alkB homolog 7, mitochondrial [Trichonephila inaurata madagascariensis]